MTTIYTSAADMLNPAASVVNFSSQFGGRGDTFVSAVGFPQRVDTKLVLEISPSSKKIVFCADITLFGSGAVLYLYEDLTVSGYVGERLIFHNTDRTSSETSAAEMQEVTSALGGSLLTFDRFAFTEGICSFLLDNSKNYGIIINGATPHAFNLRAVTREFPPVQPAEYRIP